jgi:hypothetical protein
MHEVTSTYAGWRGHVIVCGLHGVGLRIVELLNSSSVPTVVIDDHPDPRLARNLAGSPSGEQRISAVGSGDQWRIQWEGCVLHTSAPQLRCK